LGLLGIVLYSVTVFDLIPVTAWNSFAVLSPVEGVLAAVVVWLLVDGMRSGRVPASVGGGALLALGASTAVSALALASFSSTWFDQTDPFLFAVLVLVGAVLTFAAGIACLRIAGPAARAGTIDSAPLVIGVAGVALAFLALFVRYDGESSLATELQEGLAPYFFSAAFACVVALVAGLALRVWPRAAAGALLASGGVLMVHYLGVVIASAQAIGDPGNTRAGGFVGILGGLLVAAAGAYTYSGVRPRSETER
jgi:hypothetical protein